jgi:PHD/YefM family antitoxin component YafN of YafNO toxin-antitoxin module
MKPVHPIRSGDIHPLTDFLRNHREAIERLRTSGRPEVLTVHGKAALVVQDAEAYEHVLQLAMDMDMYIGVREGLDEIERGEGISLDEFTRRLREKHRLPRDPDATGTEGR